MTWNRLHRRSDVLRAVVDTLDARTGDPGQRVGTLPWDLPGVAENFTDESDLIGALLLRWHARLGANLDRELSREPLDLPGAVVAAWARTAAEHRGIRRAADECLVDPLTAALEQTVLRARDRERARLAAAAGLAPERHPAAVALGADLEERARELAALPVRPPVAPHPSLTTPHPAAVHHTAQEATVLRKKNKTTTTPTAPVTPPVTLPGTARAEATETHVETNESFVRRLKAALAAA